MLDLDNNNELVAKDERVDDLKKELANLEFRVSVLEDSLTKVKI